MKTLGQLKEVYKNSPKMKLAIEQAISENGENKEAVIVAGLPSSKKGSNMHHICYIQSGWRKWNYYYGARRRYKTQGWFFICYEC